MAVRLDDLAKTVEYHRPSRRSLAEGVDRVCSAARARHLAAVCVPASDVRAAAGFLRGCDVKVVALVPPRPALAEACAAAGAAEIEVPLDADAMLAGELVAVRAEVAACVRAVRVRSMNAGRGRVLVRVAVDCARLDSKRAELACRIGEQVDADFVVTARAEGAGPALLYDVEFLRERLPDRIGVKAAGPVRSGTEVRDLLSAGATRVGTPHALEILDVRSELPRAS
jgi:deoxyribose-phosphate aldolase